MDRRTFLTTSALASGAALAAPSLLLPRRSLAATAIPNTAVANAAAITLAANGFAKKISKSDVLNAGSAQLDMYNQVKTLNFDATFKRAAQRLTLNNLLTVNAATGLVAPCVKGIQVLQPGFTQAYAMAQYNAARPTNAQLALQLDSLQTFGLSGAVLDSSHFAAKVAADPNFSLGHYNIADKVGMCRVAVGTTVAFLGIGLTLMGIMADPEGLAMLEMLAGWSSILRWAGYVMFGYSLLELTICGGDPNGGPY